MQLVSYWQRESQSEIFKKAHIEDLILSPRGLSRWGRPSLEQTTTLALKGKAMGFRPILEWDLLMTERALTQAKTLLKNLPVEVFYAIRVRDPGALAFIKREYPRQNIQLILESGPHNLLGLKGWCEIAGRRLERVILSLELTREALASSIKGLPVPVEVLGLGPILLFSTPRALLTPRFSGGGGGGGGSEMIQIIGHSEETPHKGFPILENEQGTFMFNTKDRCLLEQMDELAHMGLSYFRLDLRSASTASSEDLHIPIGNLLRNFSPEKAQDIKKRYPRKVIRGFYSANRSDALFPRLKNQHIRRQNTHSHYLGDVVDVKKKGHLGLILKNARCDLKLGDILFFKTPEGREKMAPVLQLQDSSQQDLSRAQAGQLAFINHVSGVTVRTAVSVYCPDLRAAAPEVP